MSREPTIPSLREAGRGLLEPVHGRYVGGAGGFTAPGPDAVPGCDGVWCGSEGVCEGLVGGYGGEYGVCVGVGVG